MNMGICPECHNEVILDSHGLVVAHTSTKAHGTECRGSGAHPERQGQ